MKQDTNNFAKGFLDLNKEGKCSVAQIWTKKIGDNLKAKVEQQAREKFNDFIKAGNKLPINQIRKLNSVWKNDYAKEVMKETDQITKQNDEILEKEVYTLYDDMAFNEMETEDCKQDWKRSVTKIDDKIRKKAERSGIIREVFVTAKDESVEQDYKQLPFIRQKNIQREIKQKVNFDLFSKKPRGAL